MPPHLSPRPELWPRPAVPRSPSHRAWTAKGTYWSGDPCPPSWQCAGLTQPHLEVSGKIREKSLCAATSWTVGAIACSHGPRSQISASSRPRPCPPSGPHPERAPGIQRGIMLGASWACLHHPIPEGVPKAQRSPPKVMPSTPRALVGLAMFSPLCSQALLGVHEPRKTCVPIPKTHLDGR